MTNRFQSVLDVQREHFLSDASKSHDWRIDQLDRMERLLSFGGGCVNQTNLHCWIDSLPFGGVGSSGMGKYYGRAGFDALSNTKAMLIGNPDLELDVFPPYAGKDIAKNPSVFA